jgi:hypothetical protein
MGRNMAKGHRVDISATASGNLIVMQLAGGTDEIVITYRLTATEAVKLVSEIEKQLVRLKPPQGEDVT